MPASDSIQIALYFAILFALTPLLGGYLANVFSGRPLLLDRVLGPVERVFYRLASIDPALEMNGKSYVFSVLAMSGIGLLVTFGIQLLQHELPLNPLDLPNVPWALAFNTAVSFVTNTNWQAYAGETTLSYLTQSLTLNVQNFLSAATGLAVMAAFVRGLSRERAQGIGNFWVDLTKATLYVLLPASLILAVLLMGEGVVQNWSAVADIPTGPAASQIAIKQLGANGGGFFGANSAHPFENPTPISNFLEMLSILLFPMALVYAFGVMVRSRRHAGVLYAVMMLFLVSFLAVSLWSEYRPNPITSIAGSMEGKETRFGVPSSVLWSVVTTATSNGSVNALHDSLTPLSGGVALLQMLFGEILFGGLGSGIYGMLLFVILAVFLAGLMIGRTPEYLGKKIESREIQLVLVALLLPGIVVLIGTGMSMVLRDGLAGISNHGPHGLTQVLYAWASATNNNGSAFAGLSANTNYYNILLAMAMLLGRFAVMACILLVAESLALKKITPPSPGTMSTESITFAILLISVIVLVASLTFVPVLALGPVVEHFLMNAGRVF